MEGEKQNGRREGRRGSQRGKGHGNYQATEIWGENKTVKITSAEAGKRYQSEKISTFQEKEKSENEKIVGSVNEIKVK